MKLIKKACLNILMLSITLLVSVSSQANNFKMATTNEITISFRSTEFIEDYKKDTTTDKEITDNGTAIAQNISMVRYIEDLKSKQIIKATDNISITGYSLGGHIDSNFFKMYEDELNLINNK